MEKELNRNLTDDDFKGFCQDPDVWNFDTLCQSCLNQIDGGTCDVYDSSEQCKHQFECNMYLKRESK